MPSAFIQTVKHTNACSSHANPAWLQTGMLPFLLLALLLGLPQRNVAEQVQHDEATVGSRLFVEAGINQHSFVIIALNTDELLIDDGTISATSGKSVHLLPGTQIKAVDRQVISIVSTKHQEAIEEIARRERIEFAKSVMLRRTHEYRITDTRFLFSKPPPQNGGDSVIAEKLFVTAVLPARVHVSPPLLLTALKTKSYEKHQLKTNSTGIFARQCDPVYSWGKRPETIMVMLA